VNAVPPKKLKASRTAKRKGKAPRQGKHQTQAKWKGKGKAKVMVMEPAVEAGKGPSMETWSDHI
jgi:hypothetical protein